VCQQKSHQQVEEQAMVSIKENININWPCKGYF
jgi:hypothetical protein